MDHELKSFGAIGTVLSGAAFVLLATLKLTGAVQWSWWWITAPLWVLGAFAAGFIVVALIGLALLDDD